MAYFYSIVTKLCKKFSSGKHWKKEFQVIYRNLVEINYILGLESEAKKYAVLLGYNYQSSKWYEETYKVLNKDYVKISKNKNKAKEDSIIKKFKDLLK